MRVNFLEFKNYRNLHEGTVEFSSGINVIYGENAQGKTNLLEAVWLLTGARSFRGSKDKDLVSFRADYTRINGAVEAEGRENEIKITLKDNKRMAEINEINRGVATNIIGFFKAVIFSPEHLSLIKGSPENRRKFIDAAICQMKPVYAVQLVKYNRTLKHRNFLLKSISHSPMLEDTLEIWDKKLAEYASVVIEERIKYTEEISKTAEKFYFEISGGETLKIDYASWEKFKGLTKNEIKEFFVKKLQGSRKEDIAKGITGSGPHRDEINISINGKPARLFGSQGQQRSAAICLKFSEAQIATKAAKEPPIILLDDILSELDEKRQNQLFKLAGEAQVLITGCIKPVMKLKHKNFFVEKGKIFTEE